MKALIRTDASTQIGTGHVMRCLTLAGSLVGSGATVEFVCRMLPGHLCDQIEEQGYSVHRMNDTSDGRSVGTNWLLRRGLGVSVADDLVDTRCVVGQLPGGYDWLIVDHYWLDASWEEPMQDLVGNIMVIDDLADRMHCCDLMLDSGYFHHADERYRHLVPYDCTMLLGPQYLLLRPEFLAARKQLAERDGRIRRILVFFGGVDRTNETGKTLKALATLDRYDLKVDVVIGQAFPYGEELNVLASSLKQCQLHYNVTDMANLMTRADLAIGAGGTTTWERLYLGLPTLTIMVADNQVIQTETLEHERCLDSLGWYANVAPENIASRVRQLMLDPNRLMEMSNRGLQLTAQTHGSDAVVAVMKERLGVYA